MKAVHVQSYDGPEALQIVEIPEPEGEGVSVDVHAAGVSFADVLMSQGLYQVRDEPPFVPGMEMAGVVRSAPDSSGFAPGDRVCGSVSGAFAEVVLASPDRLFALPEALDFAQGAALTVNYQTAVFALQNRAVLRQGESLLVLGAAGGVGTSAIQVARGLGASTILGLVSTEEKAAIARDVGADQVFLIGDGWKDRVRAATAGHGVDLVYDPVGHDLFLDALRSLATGGRLLVIGFAGGTIPEVRVNRLLLTNTSVVGAAWGQAVALDPDLPQRIHRRLVPLIEQGFVRPPIGPTYGLDDAAEAYRCLAERRATGKVILTVR